MPVDMTTQSIAVADNWVKVGNDYVGDKQNGATSGGDAALGWSANDGLVDGSAFTVTTDGTYDFGTKVNAKPLLYWRADDGASANLTLGRVNWTGGTNDNTLTTAITAPNSTQSYYFDHGASSGDALGRVDFSSRDVYVFRKVYEAFDLSDAYAIRTRVNLSSGTLVAGDTLTGQTSGATGTIRTVATTTAGAATHEIFLDRSVLSDTVNIDPPTDFVYGETMLAGNGASMVNEEGSTEFPTGTFRTSNYKTCRFWGSPNNSYPIAYHTDTKYDFNHEHTDATFNSTPPNDTNFSGNTWNYQEISVRQSSAINVADAVMRFRQNTEETIQSGWISKDTDASADYDWIAQTQVSGKLDAGSLTYWDELFIDEGFNRVMLGDAATWATCTKFEPQPYTSWSGATVIGAFNQGSLTSISGSYLYIINEDDIPVQAVGLIL